MGEAARRKQAGTYPTTKFVPGVVAVTDQNGQRRPFWIDANGAVHEMRVTRRIFDPALVDAVRSAAQILTPDGTSGIV